MTAPASRLTLGWGIPYWYPWGPSWKDAGAGGHGCSSCCVVCQGSTAQDYVRGWRRPMQRGWGGCSGAGFQVPRMVQDAQGRKGCPGWQGDTFTDGFFCWGGAACPRVCRGPGRDGGGYRCPPGPVAGQARGGSQRVQMRSLPVPNGCGTGLRDARRVRRPVGAAPGVVQIPGRAVPGLVSAAAGPWMPDRCGTGTGWRCRRRQGRGAAVRPLPRPPPPCTRRALPVRGRAGLS